MSKIAEQKALEEYPTYYFFEKREGYVKGYDQAFKDFMEKACGYLAGIALTHPFLLDLDRFTKYMQDE